MIQTGFESRVKVYQIIENQLPEFVLDESPKAVEFLKQYYISQEYQGGPIDISENLDQYLKIDNLIPEVIVGYTGLSTNISSSVGIITVTSTKGFPQKYGLLKIDDEIITYTGITTNTFTGCIRGFSGITNYHQDLNSEELVFSSSSSSSHISSSKVQNLSSLFLKEFYKKIKYTLTPGLENLNFVSDLNVGNFIKEARTLYQSKGTSESFRILFNVLFGETPRIVDLEQFLIKPSSASYLRRKVIVVDAISGDPLKLKGQTIFKSNDSNTTASVSEVELIRRNGKNYYKLFLFIGYDDTFPTISGKFNITGNTKNTKSVSIGSSVITVDSTIGFPGIGTIYYNNNKITYTDKSIDQFFGCSGITSEIPIASLIRSNETYYGYENGDNTSKVEFIINGVLSEYDSSSDNILFDEGDSIGIQHIGENIENVVINPSYKQIFANSWKYNTTSNFATSSSVSLEYDKITSDVQNVYNQNDEYMYVASNSLPSYNISKDIFSYNATGVSDQNENNGLYSKIIFSQKISFLTGSEIYYKPSNNPIPGLSEGVYFVEVFYPDILNQPNRSEIKLYYSRSVIGTTNYIEFGELTTGNHNFTLKTQKEKILSPQKILRKFPLSVNIGDGQSNKTKTGGIGLLINGVEITSYKSDDKIYYGPLKSVDVVSGGKDYDVINPPNLTLSSGNAKIQPVIKGSVKRIYVDPQNFDVDVVVSVSLTGGNGKGASFEPVIRRRRREIEFDARLLEYGGGVDVTNETITFKTNHGLINGEPIIYHPGNNPKLGIGIFKGSNFDLGKTLTKEGTYYTKYISDTTIQLYESISDFNAGINTVGFTTIGTSGLQKFLTNPKNTLSEIKVLNGGYGYTNRKLRVSQSGISTVNHTIFFNNHGFEDGELVTYNYEDTQIIGLSTSNQYHVLKLDNNTFRLSNAGIGGTSQIDYDKRKHVYFNSTGVGYQIFNYPEINISVNYCSVGIGSTQFKGTISATPIVRGEISDVFVYENGSDYGSTILNFHKKPSIQIKNGKDAQLVPIISNGSIQEVVIQYGGSEYYSLPDIEVSGSGLGAILKPVLSNNKIIDVIIVNKGIGYSTSNTTIKVVSSGKNAILDPQIRSLTVNNNKIYKSINDNTLFANEIIKSSYNNLQYSVSGYSELVQNEFNDTSLTHSPIIGWAYDGNPIYGSYGYSDPSDKNSEIKRLQSGYTLDVNNISNRPSGFDEGFFIEDYKFTNSGDLDQYNGRFCFTEDFPNGIYAYFATSVVDNNNNLVGSFPYFIGDEYRSKFVEENITLNQSFDFNNSNLIRNVYPYILDSQYLAYDFTQSINQVAKVESVLSGSIEDFEIINSGDNYKVGDTLEFDESISGGGGLFSQVSEIEGKEIISLQSSVQSYNNALFTWKNSNQIQINISPNHNLENYDYVNISGFTTSLSFLNGYHKIGVSSYSSVLINNLPSSGIITDIYVSRIPENISIGSSIGIGTETLKVLNIFDGILRVVRGNVSLSHTATTSVYFIPDTFTVNKTSNYFDSTKNDIVYFNPKYAVGIGTTSGIGIAVTNNVGIQTNNIISIPTQSIYLPNHPFKTNQELILRRPQSASVISVANTSGSSAFNLLTSNTEKVYAIRKSIDHIGIVTQIGLTTSTDGLYFISNGSDDYQYSFESNFSQITGNIKKISTLVSISTEHQLTNDDTIDLIVQPNLSVGIGTSNSIKVVRDITTNFILVNPIGFNSTGINTSASRINLPSHKLNTGDKIKYTADQVASGLQTGFYYVYKVDDDNIKLCESYLETKLNPPYTVSIANTGGSNQTISLVNPSIISFKNNNIVFDLTDSSLSGYNFKIFYDQDFNDEFVSVGSTNAFSIIGIGTVGISTNASLTINYNSKIPSQLFYALEKTGFISTADKEVKNYCQIDFSDSNYCGTYKISGIGSTTFTISLSKYPEKLTYNKNECDKLQYFTKSNSASGGVSKIRIISPGYNFKKLPIFSTINSENGKDCNIIAKSTSIGKINQLRITNEGFDYSSDKTLKPKSKNNFKTLNGYFNVDFSSIKNIGWIDDIGKLNEELQVIPDNNYYQNLSYTIKSSQTWDTIVSPVNNILHTSGLKNFSDTEILNNSTISIGSSSYTISIYDIINENRVDTINNFDFAKDFAIGINTSEYLKFKQKRFTDYINCTTNKVLGIDDISFEFSTSDQTIDSNPFLLIDEFIPSKKYEKYLVQISNNDFSNVQFTELVILIADDDVYTLEKGSITSGFSTEIGYQTNQIANIYGYRDNLGSSYLRFEPIFDPYNISYNIKYLNTSFENFISGIGTKSVGFINLSGVTTTVSYGSTETLISTPKTDIKSIYSEINIINNDTKEINYIEVFVDHDGTNTNLSEFYFDNNEVTSNFIGSFGASISGGILKFDYTNTTNNSVTIRSRNIGFGTTSIGQGLYRFKKEDQPDNTERTINYTSLYSNVSSASTIVSFNNNYFGSVKSLIRIGIGQTSALHQVLMISDSNNVYTTQYPFLSIGSTSGIGTFGGEINGNITSLKFYPDANISGNFEILSFNQSFYKENDSNIPSDLLYGNIKEKVRTNKYFALNDDDINKTDFDLFYQGVPIFAQSFNPSDSSILNLATGEFNIPHFFNTGEELIYTPKSTYFGISASAVGIGSTLNYVGVVTNILPSTVYAYRVSSDKFKISTRKEYALSGICVTFTSSGSGNAHEFEMFKKNEKTIISIDNVIQSPIAYSLLNYTINNGSNIGYATSIFGLSGISSINLGDILKIDNEYMKIENVGLGTTYTGPISFAGTFPLVQVKRGFVGSSATTHSNLGIASIYKGSYNIVGNKIYFTESPKGSLEDQINVDLDNLPESRSSFDGRVFLRKNYDENKIYDNISDRFTGIGKTYTLTIGGINTVGLGTSGGNGIVLINGIYQTPTTENNPNNNFRIIENSGISSVVFSGIRTEGGISNFISDFDVNMNQLPRGGLIVSLGSTPGLGYAPLVGASVTAIISGGVITSIGIGTTGNWGSGYRNPVSVAVTDSTGSSAVISANIGVGGSLSFTISNGGNNYTNPNIIISPPNYENLPVIGVSRLGIGATTSTGYDLLLNVEVGASSTTGIGSTLFEVKDFKIIRSGYGFKKGDVFKPIGLVTDYGLATPIKEFELTVLETFNDSFSAWQFGKLDYIDSIKNLQDGVRTTFPLYYNSQLLSFEKSDPDIDFGLLLLIFVNGVLQQSGSSYQFNGGTSFTFSEAPDKNDNVNIFFYRGSNEDSAIFNVFETIKPGDTVQVFSSNENLSNTITQDKRIVSGITTSDTIQTELYNLQGIDEENYKPVSWTKQKNDQIINNQVISKSRDSIESQIYPTSKVIKSFGYNDTEIYIDSVELFNYENEIIPQFDSLIISGMNDPVSAAITAIISSAGTVQSLIINNPGSGYNGISVDVKISSPSIIGVGIGTTATASISIVNGSLSGPITITNPGLGYTTITPPQVIAPLPNPIYENISDISFVEGYHGFITGIGTTTGIGTDLAIKFTISPTTGISVNNPIYIFDTKVGQGVTSIYSQNNQIIGIGTIFLDNIYNISAFNSSTGIITCNIQSNSSVIGIATTGSYVGRFSWGKLSGFTRSSSPISIAVSGYNVDSGLSTFPTIQRRGYGLRNNGAIKKQL